ncbi:MAG: hypothetical protein AB1Z23_03360 [Eubacteriales bacterium]
MTVGELKIKLSADAVDFDRGIGSAKDALSSMEAKGAAAAQNAAAIAAQIAQSVKNAAPAFAEAGGAAFGAIDSNVPAVAEEIATSVPYIVGRIQSEFALHSEGMAQTGSSLMSGIGQGISSSLGGILQAVNSVGQSVLQEIESVFQIASPSKKTAYLGEMIGEGLAEGINRSLEKVEISAGGMYAAAMDTAPRAGSVYNTYHTTYNAPNTAGSAAGMADFENRIRRAYA